MAPPNPRRKSSANKAIKEAMGRPRNHSPAVEDAPASETSDTKTSYGDGSAPVAPGPISDIFLDAASGTRKAEQEAATQIGSLPRYPLSRIAAHPDNPPKRSTDTETARDVAESVKERGLNQPVTIAERWRIEQDDPEAASRLPDDAEWVIIHGHIRCAAHRIAQIPNIPALLREGPCDKVTVTGLFFDENFQRETPDPIMEAEAYHRLKDAGQSTTQIAAIRRVAQSQVSKTMKLIKLPAAVADSVRAGSLTRADAYAYIDLDDQTRDASWKAWQKDPETPLRVHARRIQQKSTSTGDTDAADAGADSGSADPEQVIATREEAIDTALGHTVSATVRADALADALLAPRPRKSDLATWKSRVAKTLGVELPDNVPLTDAGLRQSVYRKIALGVALWALESDAAEDDQTDGPFRPHVTRHIQRLAELGVYQPTPDEADRMTD